MQGSSVGLPLALVSLSLDAWTSDLGRGRGSSSSASTLPLGKQGTPPEITWVAQLQQSH